MWIETANILKTINEHVLEDVEDHIILEAFGNMSKANINELIESDQT